MRTADSVAEAAAAGAVAGAVAVVVTAGDCALDADVVVEEVVL